jgi:type IV secretion system protein VirD4
MDQKRIEEIEAKLAADLAEIEEMAARHEAAMRPLRARARIVNTYSFWHATKASLTSWRTWVTLLGLPFLLYAFLGFQWTLLLAIVYFAGGAFWAADGVRCLSWDMADQVSLTFLPDSESRNYPLRGTVLLTALCALTYGLWLLAWWIATSRFAAVCSPPSSFPEHIEPLLREVGGCLALYGAPSVRGTLIFAGVLTALDVAVCWIEELYEDGKFAWLPRLGGAARRAGGGVSPSGAVDFFADMAGRGRAALGGLVWTAVAALVLWFAWEFDNTVIRIAGGGVGGYLLFVRGLGPLVTALNWSRLDMDTHGNARTATVEELRQAELMPRSDGAIYLGNFLDNGREVEAVGYPGGSHLVTIGKPGSGKGTGIIVPNLSTLRRSILIIDPKGEAAAITARKRAKFGRVVMLNPFNIFADKRLWMKSDGFNPLSTVRTDDNFLDDCTIIAQSLIKQEKDGTGRFFSGSAHDFLTALIMHEILERKDKANLAHVRKLLTEEYGVKDGFPIGIARTIFDMSESQFEPLKAKATRYKSDSKSNADVIRTALFETAFMDSPQVGADLASETTFRFADMKNEIVTVYLVLPATHLESHSNWLRLMIACALRELLATTPSRTLPPVLFMLDEFAQLSHLPMISNAMNIARGFGVTLWPFVQDLNQLKDIYHDKWENFLGASAVRAAFAPSDVFTSEYLSKLCGNKTIIVESENERTGAPGMGRSRGPQSVPLFRPEDLRNMPHGQMLCFVDPVKNPFMARAPGYWDTDFADGLDLNPYYQRSTLP